LVGGARQHLEGAIAPGQVGGHRFRVRSKADRTFCALTAACSAACPWRHAVYEELPPLSLSHRARRSALALQQRRTPGFPGAVIHLFKLLDLAGMMRAALRLFIPSLKRGTVPEAIENQSPGFPWRRLWRLHQNFSTRLPCVQ
jgi:hypothetical protein